MIKKVRFIAGKLEVTDDNSQVKVYDIANYLRAADIPSDLLISSLTLLTTLGNVVEVIVKTLIEQGILDESLVSGYDMQYVLDTLKDDINTDIGD